MGQRALGGEHAGRRRVEPAPSGADDVGAQPERQRLGLGVPRHRTSATALDHDVEQLRPAGSGHDRRPATPGSRCSRPPRRRPASRGGQHLVGTVQASASISTTSLASTAAAEPAGSTTSASMSLRCRRRANDDPLVVGVDGQHADVAAADQRLAGEVGPADHGHGGVGGQRDRTAGRASGRPRSRSARSCGGLERRRPR